MAEKNARDYFYNVIFGVETSYKYDFKKIPKNFKYDNQETEKADQEYRNKFKDKRSFYSNDPIIDSYVIDFIIRNRKWVDADFFEDFFLGRVMDNFNYSATSEAKTYKYTGKLSYFYEGIQEAVALVYQCFFFIRLNQNDSLKKEVLLDLVDVFSCFRLSNLNYIKHIAFIFVRKYGYKELVPTKHWLISANKSDRFIVAHEIAHHLAGDTGFKHRYSKELQSLRNIIKESHKHLKKDKLDCEFFADVLAVNLFLGDLVTSDILESPNEQSLASASIGAMGTLITLSLLSENPYLDSKATLSIHERISNVRTYLMFFSITNVMIRSQKKLPDDGLGSRIKALTKEFCNFYDEINYIRFSKNEF
jgi:hypothetical protein